MLIPLRIYNTKIEIVTINFNRESAETNTLKKTKNTSIRY